MSSYQSTLDFLFTQLPMFQNIGAGAYKPGLGTVECLAKAFGNPHKCYPSIHVGGTNGKGSTAHSLAAILQSAGYRTGLFTSPHLLDFRERIRVNGHMIDKEDVVDFVDRYNMLGLDMSPSFFELTTVMAMEYFARNNVDIAVFEVGLGGRLDSTNIISPILSVITNISKDHVALLGDTLEAIAIEKAGIIKPGVPVVIGEASHKGVRDVFLNTASENSASIVFSDCNVPFSRAMHIKNGISYHDTPFGDVVECELSGECQIKNTSTIMNAVLQLRKLGMEIPDKAVVTGLADVTHLTGLAGRWMRVSDSPTVICDTGHNVGGWEYLSATLADIPELHVVLGFVSDKDVSGILGMMPRHARYYFTSASVCRALPADALCTQAKEFGLEGEIYQSVEDAYYAARGVASENATIFVGGSTFIVADFLALKDV